MELQSNKIQTKEIHLAGLIYSTIPSEDFHVIFLHEESQINEYGKKEFEKYLLKSLQNGNC